MKGYLGSVLHGAHSITPLKIRGHFAACGPQPIGRPGGVPQWVADAMAGNPNIESIAINGKDSGVVFSRMKDEGAVEKEAQS